MRASAFETILPNTPITTLPLTLQQTSSNSSPLLMLALALPAAIAVLTPFFLIAAHAAQNTQLLVARPHTSMQLALALVIWALVFGWPIARRTRRMTGNRAISIIANTVTVRDHNLFNTQTWTQPLSAYRGVAHHVRASLSGTRHELLLIHPDPARSLLLRVADKIGQSEIDHTVLLLGCREIAPQVFYRNTQHVGRRPVSRILCLASAKLAPTGASAS